MSRFFAKSRFVALVLFLGFPAAAFAGSYEDGQESFRRGDLATAVRVWRPLADQGDARAEYGLGVAYEYGQGATVNFAEAARLYLRAAEQGLVIAQIGIEYMYTVGLGVPRDLVEAFKWSEIVATRSPASTIDAGASAQKNREFLAAKMTQAEIGDARNRATEWTPSNPTVAQMQLSAATASGRLPSNEELDALAAAQNWDGVADALYLSTDQEAIARGELWLHARVDEGGGFLLALLSAKYSWTSAGDQKTDDPTGDSPILAAKYFLYAFEVIAIDGTRCDDRTAPRARMAQLLSAGAPVLIFLKRQPPELKAKIVDFAIALEARTASLRRDDDLLCRGGNAEVSAGLAARDQHVVVVSPHHLHIGVKTPPDWTPKFVPPEDSKPIRTKLAFP